MSRHNPNDPNNPGPVNPNLSTSPNPNPGTRYNPGPAMNPGANPDPSMPPANNPGNPPADDAVTEGSQVSNPVPGNPPSHNPSHPHINPSGGPYVAPGSPSLGPTEGIEDVTEVHHRKHRTNEEVVDDPKTYRKTEYPPKS